MPATSNAQVCVAMHNTGNAQVCVAIPSTGVPRFVWPCPVLAMLRFVWPCPILTMPRFVWPCPILSMPRFVWPCPILTMYRFVWRCPKLTMHRFVWPCPVLTMPRFVWPCPVLAVPRFLYDCLLMAVPSPLGMHHSSRFQGERTDKDLKQRLKYGKHVYNNFKTTCMDLHEIKKVKSLSNPSPQTSDSNSFLIICIVCSKQLTSFLEGGKVSWPCFCGSTGAHLGPKHLMFG